MITTDGLLDFYKYKLINVTYRYRHLCSTSTSVEEATKWYKLVTDTIFSFYWNTLDEPIIFAETLMCKVDGKPILRYHNTNYQVFNDPNSFDTWVIVNNKVVPLVWDWNYLVQKYTFNSYVERVINDISCVDQVVNEIENEKLLEWEDD